MKNDFEGFVLAGGKSSRMGADKAFLKIGGETFLERAVKNLEVVCRQNVKIVLNRNQENFIENIFISAEFVFDEFENRGACGGIHAALKNSQSFFTVVSAVDMPFTKTSVLENLAQTAVELKEFSAVVPIQNDGQIQPLYAIYQTKICFPILEKLLTKNESVSAKKYLDCLNVKYFKSDETFFNVNTPQDYANLITRN